LALPNNLHPTEFCDHRKIVTADCPGTVADLGKQILKLLESE